jgi:hypothetical protein
MNQQLEPSTESATNTGFANLLELNDPTQKSYLDLTRCFPIHSSQGNLYVLVLYLYDDNAILVKPLKNRSKGKQMKAYTNLLQHIPKHQQPKGHWMDNKASATLKRMLVNEYGMSYQLVPPHIH